MSGNTDRLGRLFPNQPSRMGRAADVVRVLWPQQDQALLHISSRRTPPSGFRTIESYALVPSARSPRYLIPLSSRTVTSRSIGLYQSLRTSSRRAIRAAGAAGLRAGILQPALRDRLYVHASPQATDEDLNELSLIHHLATFFDEREVWASISLGGGGPYAKPVMQLLSGRGRPLGFVKVGWDKVTSKLVANEARLLRLCEKTSVRVRTPQVICAERWNGLELSVVSPLPEGVQRYRSEEVPSVLVTEEICRMTGGDVQRLWTSPYGQALVERMGAGTARPAAGTPDILPWLRARSESLNGRIGAWHGDWVSWNLATLGSELFAWDWEHGGDQVPLGFDIIHFYFQSAFIERALDVGEAIRHASVESVAPFRALGISPADLQIMIIFYLLEISLRVDTLLRLGGQPNPRLYPQVQSLLSRPGSILDRAHVT